jgi:hypothetical protein
MDFDEYLMIQLRIGIQAHTSKQLMYLNLMDKRNSLDRKSNCLLMYLSRKLNQLDRVIND